MEELSEKTKLIREQDTWSLVEKFNEEMVAKRVTLAELKKIVTFMVVMNADNVFNQNEKDVSDFIEKVHESMLELSRFHFDYLKSSSHEKNNTSIES